MSQIAELLQQKAGLSPEKAQEVEQIVIEHIIANVPPQFQGIVGSFLGSGEAAAEGGQSPESGGLGGLLGAASSFLGVK